MHVKSLGNILRKLREVKQLTLREVAACVDIDQAILSKVERGQRKATRGQVLKFARYFEFNEDDLLIAWLSDNIVYELEDENIALKALEAAEEKVLYLKFIKIKRKDLLKELKNGIKEFINIEKAWIYGSFAREDDGPKSDIDIALQTNEEFTYFDLAEVQYYLENKLNRKVDVGFIDSFKPSIFEHVKLDLKLIYEK
jgi:predicted nucleotidyltransferase/plasmid maintenance system antidote protein VapI